MSVRKLNLAYVEYWESEGGNVYACVGSMAQEAMFRHSNRGEPGGTWEWVAPNSPVWDRAHQAMYRNCRWDELPPETIPALPPLPEEVPDEYLPKRAYLQPREPMTEARFPCVAERIRSAPATGLPLFVVLHEDVYESSLGDGKFAYFHAVFLNEVVADAESVRLSEAEWSRGHLRRISAILHDSVIRVPDPEYQWFDRLDVLEAIEQLEKQLAGPADPDLGAPNDCPD